jgi:hypothetical protein
MINTLARNRSTDSIGDVLESSVNAALSQMLGHDALREPLGLAAAGIDPALVIQGLLSNDSDLRELFAADPNTVWPEGAKRKAVDEDEEDDDDEEEDDIADDEEEDEDEEDADEDDDLDDDEDEDEEDDEDEDEDEEDDEFDDPDDDDDYDDDDDEDDFDDE